MAIMAARAIPTNYDCYYRYTRSGFYKNVAAPQRHAAVKSHMINHHYVPRAAHPTPSATSSPPDPHAAFCPACAR